MTPRGRGSTGRGSGSSFSFVASATAGFGVEFGTLDFGELETIRLPDHVEGPARPSCGRKSCLAPHTRALETKLIRGCN